LAGLTGGLGEGDAEVGLLLLVGGGLLLSGLLHLQEVGRGARLEPGPCLGSLGEDLGPSRLVGDDVSLGLRVMGLEVSGSLGLLSLQVGLMLPKAEGRLGLEGLVRGGHYWPPP
jgi:hypothetical protein